MLLKPSPAGRVGDGTFAAKKSFATGSNPVGVLITDVTRDGIADIEVTNNFGDSVTIFSGVGDGTLGTTPTTFTVGDRPAMTAAAEFNGDGFTDLVTTNGNANSITLLLTAPPAVTTTTAASVSTGYLTNSQQVTLTATLASPGGNVFNGSVTFTVFSGTTQIGAPATALVVNGLASAIYTLPGSLAVGTYVIRANYQGNNIDFASSTDSTHSLTVTAVTSTTASASRPSISRCAAS